MSLFDLKTILSEGSIIDNRRRQDDQTITLKDTLISISKDSDGFKCSVGYFYIEGLSLIIEAMRGLKEIKILMGLETTRLTKQELIRAFKEDLDSVEKDEKNVSSIALFRSLVKESKTLQVKVYYGNERGLEKLHSKAYLFLKDTDSHNLLTRYMAGVVGSSNLTPSGLVGNTELNVIITDPKDLQYLEIWFDNLWSKGSDDFDKLRITDIILTAIEESKFGKDTEDKFVYIEPKEFFKILIKYMSADYLFEDWRESRLLGFQQVDALRCLMLFNEKNFRGVFLTSSVGLGKSYVACQVAKYFLRDNRKVLLIAPSGLIENLEQWPRYLKEFNLAGRVDILPMGMLQKDPFRFERVDLKDYEKYYSLIIIDEAHNYRNEDAFRTRNLKMIIDRNGDSKILFLTATPINTSPNDLVNLVRLFYRKGANLRFDRLYRNLLDIISLLSKTPYEHLTKKNKQLISANQENIERELFVRSTRETIKSSPEYLEQIKLFSGVDIANVPDPAIEEVVYILDIRYKNIVNNIVHFLNSLTAANLRIIDPKKGVHLSGFFKWILYKRFESDITSYYLTLKRIHKKNRLTAEAIDKRDIDILTEVEDIHEDDLEINFDYVYKEKISEVINQIKGGKAKENLRVLEDLKKDTLLIQEQLKELELFLSPKSRLLFIEDRKLAALFNLVVQNQNKKILIFSEYVDTLKAVSEFFGNRFEEGTIEFVESSTANKTNIIDRFNRDEKLRILVTTDTLSEGYNIGGADIVINFDIPYNPVRLIQRIGRATRLDNPKSIKVFNFRPAEDVDKEIDLVERLQLRIEDIIRFIGVEYRIWFQREDALLKVRREKDVKMYLEILRGIRNDRWKGEFEKLEVTIQYTRPILILMQKAILKYSITKDDVLSSKILCNSYTLLKGKKGLSFFYDDARSFNEEIITSDIDELDANIYFEKVFASEIKNFKLHLEKEKKDDLILYYYNDRTDRMIRSIKEIIITQGFDQIYPEAKILIELLSQIRDKCGASTERIVRRLHKEIKDKASVHLFKNYIKELEASFTQRMLQTKLVVEDKPYLALGFLQE